MTEAEFRTKISDQLIIYRKTFGYTQLELAEKINYSDKSISKWERAESMPDVYVLSQIAEVYGITVSDLIGETEPVKDLSKAIKKAAEERNQKQIMLEKEKEKEVKAMVEEAKARNKRLALEEKARKKAEQEAEKARKKAEAQALKQRKKEEAAEKKKQVALEKAKKRALKNADKKTTNK